MQSTLKRRSRIGRTVAFALVASVVLGVFPYFERINNPNEMVRVYMTVALCEEGTFAIDAVERRWGHVNDKARFGGHVYSSKAPGTSYLGVPVCLVHRAISRLLGHEPDKRETVLALRLGASAVPALVFFWFLQGWLARKLRSTDLPDPEAAVHLQRAVFVSVAAGSLLCAYAVTFVSHTLNAACAFGAVIALESVGERGARAHLRAALAGLLCASATLFEYPAAIATMVVGIYATLTLWRTGSRLRIASFMAGGLPALALLALFHHKAFGSPLSTGYSNLHNEAWRESTAHGFFGAGLPSPSVLARLLFDPAFGLFVCTPVLLCALFGARAAVRRRAGLAVASFAIVVLMAAFVSSLWNWRGGWTVGPRYLATVVPFLAWPALEGLLAIHRKSPTAASLVAGSTTAVALAFSALPSVLYPHVPESFRQPFSQLIVPLLRDGLAPYSLGWLFGLRGLASLAPLGAALLGLLALSTRKHDLGFVLGMAGTALAVTLWLAPPGVAQRRSIDFVERHFEPRPTPWHEEPRRETRARARAAAERGKARRAIELYGRAARGR